MPEIERGLDPGPDVGEALAPRRLDALVTGQRLGPAPDWAGVDAVLRKPFRTADILGLARHYFLTRITATRTSLDGLPLLITSARVSLM